MAYSLSFSSEFFFAEGEPYDTNAPTLDEKGNPKSLYSAILMMSEDRFKEACEDCGINPVYASVEDLVEKARETDTCSNLNTPVSVWLDSEGYHQVEVY